MGKLFSFKKLTKKDYEEEMPEGDDEYLELDTEGEPESDDKVQVRTFSIDDFSDIKPILDTLREGYTIALIDISPLKDKDLVELKRAINKLKKTTQAIDGDIAGFGDDYIVATPSFAEIERSSSTNEPDVEE